jgi:hypothetical protein
MAKRHSYPHFHISGLVSATEHGQLRSVITVRAHCYISWREEAYSALVRDAKWRLECVGVPKEKLDALYFEDEGITDIHALDARGLAIEDGERPEAFLDSPALKNRATLIRQRRLVPDDQRDMLEMYAPKVKATAAPVSEGVAA